jgi:hypothetical protein
MSSLGYVAEVGSEALVAAVLVTEGAQLLVVQNHKATSIDLASTGGADFMQWHTAQFCYQQQNWHFVAVVVMWRSGG